MNLNIKYINTIFIYIVLSRVRLIINLVIKSYINYNRFSIDRTLYVKIRINDKYRR